jgi:hypothetical protein
MGEDKKLRRFLADYGVPFFPGGAVFALYRDSIWKCQLIRPQVKVTTH